MRAVQAFRKSLGRLFCALRLLTDGAKERLGGQARRKRASTRSPNIPKVGSKGSQRGRTRLRLQHAGGKERARVMLCTSS